MSDPRFARLRSDPRFRRIRTQHAKVVVDDRFKGLFTADARKKKNSQPRAPVDKYGRPLADTHEEDALRRFYRLEHEDRPEESAPNGPDYARGEALLESSDDEDDADKNASDQEDGVVVLGRDVSTPIPVSEDEVEIDLDESQFADLDAQAEAYANRQDAQQSTTVGPPAESTRRLAIVNLDWDHVRAVHLFKIVSSLVSPTAVSLSSTSRNTPGQNAKDTKARVALGKVLSVRVYPSQFGKERMAREEAEGPPADIFKQGSRLESQEDVNEVTVYETGDEQDYNEDALRRYQLERLRYYYAIVECDTVEAASHIYAELDGTELERSANVFDLSFVPDGMSFDDEPRDDATDDLNAPYKSLEFVTDALRHSKVKLTWDDDDLERSQITRRTLSRKEIEENDFKAYIASSDSELEDDTTAGNVSREKLRALLLDGGDDALPEGWGKSEAVEGDAEMEITFTPGLSAVKGVEDETTLETYKRKMKDKKKKRKESRLEKNVEQETKGEGVLGGDGFFAGSDDDQSGNNDEVPIKKSMGNKEKGKRHGKDEETFPEPSSWKPSTAEELALIATSDNPDSEPKHFDMKAIIKKEKGKGKKKRQKKGKTTDQAEYETQDGFEINVEDDRFVALHEDHTFAIDPSNPHFKKTKSMSALLDERSKMQHNKKLKEPPVNSTTEGSSRDLKRLVESVKRKSFALQSPGVGKRRKL